MTSTRTPGPIEAGYDDTEAEIEDDAMAVDLDALTRRLRGGPRGLAVRIDGELEEDHFIVGDLWVAPSSELVPSEPEGTSPSGAG